MTRSILAAAVGLLVAAGPARAELVFFATGRVMSVAGHRVEGDRIVLLPRDGGEITLGQSLIARIEPDEMPYPQPAAQAPSAAPIPGEVVASGGPHQYDAIIDRVATEQGVDAKLVRAVIQVESNYQERARSAKGAMGLMQLMPDTAQRYALVDPYDPTSNIEAGIKYLRTLLDRFPERLALAAYNAGEAAVERFRGIPPYPETRDYVARILRIAGR